MSNFMTFRKGHFIGPEKAKQLLHFKFLILLLFLTLNVYVFKYLVFIRILICVVYVASTSLNFLNIWHSL